MANNQINIQAATQGLSQVLRDMANLARQLRSLQQQAGAATTAQNTQANASRNQARAANDASEAVGGLANTHRNAARQMSELAKSSSAAVAIAYAEIAATVFSLSAAFNFLKDASNYSALIETQKLYARETGVNMAIIAKAIMNATDASVDLAHASQLASIGKTAGFNTEQIEKLAKVAKAAATILGRDVPESLDRAFRGVAKGEPEILDELGIFIRLDQAQLNYANKYNLKVQQLNTYQKTQATYMEAMAKAQQAYGEVIDKATTNPFAQAQASFITSVKELTSTFTSYVAPFVSYLAANKDTLGAIALIFGGGALKTAASALFSPKNVQEKIAGLQKIIEGDKLVIKNAREAFKSSIPTAFTNNQLNNQATRAIQDKVQAAVRLSDTIDKMNLRANSQIKAINDAFKQGLFTTTEYMDRITKAVANGKEFSREITRQAALIANDPTRTSKIGGSKIDNSHILEAEAALTSYNTAANRAVGTTLTLSNAWRLATLAGRMLTVGTEQLATSVKLFFYSLYAKVEGLTRIISAAMSVVSTFFIVFEGAKIAADYFDLLTKNIDQLYDSIKSAGSAIEQSSKSMQKFRDLSTFAGNLGSVSAYANVLQTTVDSLNQIAEAADNVSFGKFSNVLTASSEDVIRFKKLLDTIPKDKLSLNTKNLIFGFEGLDPAGISQKNFAKMSSDITRVISSELGKSLENATALSEGLKNISALAQQATKSYIDFATEITTKTPYDSLLQEFTNIQTEMANTTKLISIGMTDNDKNVVRGSILAVTALNKSWQDAIPTESLDNIYGLTVGMSKLNYIINDQVKDLDKSRRAFLSIQETTEKNIASIQKWGEGFSNTFFDISKITSAKASYAQLTGELASLNMELETIQNKDFANAFLKSRAIDSVTKKIKGTNAKLSTIYPSVEKSAKSIDEFVLGHVNQSDISFETSMKAIRDKAGKDLTKTAEAEIMAAKVARATAKNIGIATYDQFKESVISLKDSILGTISPLEKLKNMIDISGKDYSTDLQSAVDSVYTLINQLDVMYTKYLNIVGIEQTRLKIMREMVDANNEAATKAQLASRLSSSTYTDRYISASNEMRDSGRALQDTRLASILQSINLGVSSNSSIAVPPEYSGLIVAAKAVQEASKNIDGKGIDAEKLAEAKVKYAEVTEEVRKSLYAQSDSQTKLNSTMINAIKLKSDEYDSYQRTIEAMTTFKESLRTLLDGLLSPGNGNLSKSAADAKDKLLGGLKKNLGDKIFGQAKTQISDAMAKLPGVGNALSKIGGLGKMLSNFKGGGIMAGIGSILSGDKGAGIGQILGTIVGGPIGALIGGALLSGFGKKVLKETGIIAKVNAEGILSAQIINIYKKKGLTGSKTIENIVGNISSDAQMALQDSIFKIRDGFTSNMKQLSVYTSGALKLNQDLFKKFTFSRRFLVGAGSDTSGLYDQVKTAYGDALVQGIAPLIKAFTIANEGLANTLERITHIVKVTDNTFNAVFFKSSGKGIASILPKEYVQTFAKGLLNFNIDQVISAYPKSGWKNPQAIVKRVFTPLRVLADTGVQGYVDLEDFIQKSVEKYKDSISNTGDRSSAFIGGSVQRYEYTLRQQIKQYQGVYDTFYDNNKALIEFLNGNTGFESQIRELAKLDFYNKMFQAFSGATTDEKKKNFDEAMSKYANGVGSSLETLAGNFSQLAIELASTDGLPDTVKAAADNVITPIFTFNEQLKNAIEGGASPSEVAKAIETGAKLSDVIQSILQVFSSINISNVSSKADFITNVISGITDTFKTSLLDQFKKVLVTPILGGILNGTGETGLTASDIAKAGDSLVARAKELIGVLNNSNTSTALGLVGTEFEKLMKEFGSLDAATSLSNINKVIKDITADLKQSAFDFLTGGDAYSSNLFKASELFKSVGLSGSLSTKPLSEVFDTIKGMIANGTLASDSIDAVSNALRAMAEVTKAARQQIADTVTATRGLVEDTFGKIKDISLTIASNSGDIGKAKLVLSDLLQYPADQLAKARDVYQKAKTSGNLLAATNAGTALSTALSNYMSDQITMQEALQKMEQDKYDTEKQAIQDITDWTKQLADFAKSLKFDEKLSILAPIDRLTEASKSFDQLKQDLLTKSASSNLTADDIKAIQDESKQLLELGRDVYASGDQYTALYNEVQRLLDSTAATLTSNQGSLEASTKAYQDNSLAYAQQMRDIQLSTLEELKSINSSALYDNTVSSQLLDAIKFNQAVPSGITLSDYYAQLFAAAQSGIGTFTGVGTGFPDFTQGTANQQNPDSATQPTTANLNERLVSTLERLEAVLALLPLGIKTAVTAQQTAATRS